MNGPKKRGRSAVIEAFSTSAVAQQLRNAFFDLDQLPMAMVMDRDTIFAAIAAQTLPAMGISAIKTDPRCPWQNGVVQRFHRTL